MLTPKLRTIILTAAQEIMPSLTAVPPKESVPSKAAEEPPNLQQLLIHEALSKNQSEINHNEEDISHQGKKARNPPVYRKYSLQFKHRLIEEIKSDSRKLRISQSTAIRRKAKEHGIHPKNIYRWYRSKELRRKVSGRKALFPEMQQKLMDFILRHPTRSPKRRDILSQARKILDDLEIEGREDFTFSKGWYQRFRERMNRITSIDISPLEPQVVVDVSQRKKGKSKSGGQLVIEKLSEKMKVEEIERCLMETIKIEVGEEDRSTARKGKRTNSLKVEWTEVRQCEHNEERHSLIPEQ